MQIITLALFLISLFSSVAAIPAVNVTADIEQNSAYANTPLTGTLTITHPKSQVIDNKSFKMNGKPLPVEFLRDVPLSGTSDLTISLYRFTMPGTPAGLQLIPEITVKIGNQTYQTISTGFEVKAGSPPSQTTASFPTQTTSKAILQLEAFYNGPPTLYVGQRAWVGYRYFFNQSVDLTEEAIPLLNAEGFKKIGGKQINDAQEGEFSVRQVSQQIEALKEGEYSFGPSMIKGVTAAQVPISAQAQPVTIHVKDFPKAGKPETFTGAIGQFTFTVSMLTPSTVRVGDKISLLMTINGTGELSAIKPPDLCCRPGFTGVFKAPDIPPLGRIQNDAVQFTVDIRPLTPSIKEIPSISFSYFDPVPGRYVTVTSEPIPITVTPAPSGEQPSSTQTPTTRPIEINGNERLTVSDLANLPFGTWWSLILVPIGLGLVWIQYSLRSSIEQIRAERKKETAQSLFDALVATKKYDSEYFYFLNRSFFLLFHEKGLIDQVDITPQRLPDGPPFDKVKQFLLELEKRRFGPSDGKVFTDADRENYIALFNEIKGGTQ